MMFKALRKFFGMSETLTIKAAGEKTNPIRIRQWIRSDRANVANFATELLRLRCQSEFEGGDVEALQVPAFGVLSGLDQVINTALYRERNDLPGSERYAEKLKEVESLCGKDDELRPLLELIGRPLLAMWNMAMDPEWPFHGGHINDEECKAFMQDAAKAFSRARNLDE